MPQCFIRLYSWHCHRLITALNGNGLNGLPIHDAAGCGSARRDSDGGPEGPVSIEGLDSLYGGAATRVDILEAATEACKTALGYDHSALGRLLSRSLDLDAVFSLLDLRESDSATGSDGHPLDE